MDLIFAVLGLLALLVDSIRCQGVYGECARRTVNLYSCWHDLVKRHIKNKKNPLRI